MVLVFELLGLSGLGGLGLATLAQGCFVAGSTRIGGSLYVLASFSYAAPKSVPQGREDNVAYRQRKARIKGCHSGPRRR